MRKRRECRVCGTIYSYCPTCSQDKYKPTWMTEFHEENCMKVWDTASRFNMGMITKEEAQAVILELDLSKQESFADFIKEDIAKILEEDIKPKRGKRAELDIIEDAMPTATHEVVKTIE